MGPVLGVPHSTPWGFVAVTIQGSRLKQLYEARAKVHEARARHAEALLAKAPHPLPRGAGRVVPMRPRPGPAEIHAALHHDPLEWNRPEVERAADDERRMVDHLTLVSDLLEPDRKYDVSEELILRLVGPVHRSVVDHLFDPSPLGVAMEGDLPGSGGPPSVS